jgi:DNA-directed RNA polymerase subunit RPC12/RpoP
MKLRVASNRLPDLVDTSAHSFVTNERDRYRKELEQERASCARLEEKYLESEKIWKKRLDEEVSNHINHRMATLKCSDCEDLFWVDKEANFQRYTGYKCPYCGSAFRTHRFPYSIYLHPNDEAQILVDLPNQNEATVQIEIRSNDETHYIVIPLDLDIMPYILEKKFEETLLSLYVKLQKRRPATFHNIPLSEKNGR